MNNLNNPEINALHERDYIVCSTVHSKISDFIVRSTYSSNNSHAHNYVLTSQTFSIFFRTSIVFGRTFL